MGGTTQEDNKNNDDNKNDKEEDNQNYENNQFSLFRDGVQTKTSPFSTRNFI